MTPEQRAKEEAFSQGLINAEAETVQDLLRNGATPEGLHAVIANAGGFAEAMTQRVRDPESPPVACKAGCCWCCFQTVPVSALEAFRIARFLNDRPAHERNGSITRLRELDKQTHGKTPVDRNKLRVPCAFLVDNQCSVYSVRPLACVEFTSYNVEDCKRGQRKGFRIGSIIHEKARMLVYHAVQKGLFEGLTRALPAADNAPLELTAGVLSALDTENAEASWIAGGSLFLAAHLAGGLK